MSHPLLPIPTDAEIEETLNFVAVHLMTHSCFDPTPDLVRILSHGSLEVFVRKALEFQARERPLHFFAGLIAGRCYERRLYLTAEALSTAVRAEDRVNVLRIINDLQERTTKGAMNGSDPRTPS